MGPTRFDPNTANGYSTGDEQLECWRGHIWTVRVFTEYGQTFLVDEDEGQCPECEAWVGERAPDTGGSDDGN